MLAYCALDGYDMSSRRIPVGRPTPLSQMTKSGRSLPASHSPKRMCSEQRGAVLIEIGESTDRPDFRRPKLDWRAPRAGQLEPGLSKACLALAATDDRCFGTRSRSGFVLARAFLSLRAATARDWRSRRSHRDGP